MVEFKPKNTFVLINPSHEEIIAKMAELKMLAEKQSIKSKKANVFVFYSGHGSSIGSRLHVSVPTIIRQEDYVDLQNDLPEILPIEEIKNQLERF